MQGDNVGATHEIVELGIAHAKALLELGRWADRIVIDDGCIKPAQMFRHLLADRAEADETYGLVQQLAMLTARAFLIPTADAGAAVDLRQLAIDREHKQHGVLGDRNAVAGVKAPDTDAAFATRIEIDVVDAGAELLDKAKLLPGRHHLFRDRRGHDKGDVRIADGGHALGQSGFFDDHSMPRRRHRSFDRGLDVRMKFVEDSDSDHVHFQSANELMLY